MVFIVGRDEMMGYEISLSIVLERIMVRVVRRGIHIVKRREKVILKNYVLVSHFLANKCTSNGLTNPLEVHLFAR